MSDPKPDRILAEESDNPWVKLILWSNEDPVRPANRWNGFMKYLVEERRSFLQTLNVTEERLLGFKKDWGIDSAELRRASPLSGDELEYVKNLFPIDTNFSQLLSDITIDNLIFRTELSFAGAFFAQSISFQNCHFKRPVDFYGASFNFVATFSGSTFSKEVKFGDAQFRVPALFDRVTFCREVNFCWLQNDNNFQAGFSEAIFKKMTPVFHGRNFHPACDFHGVTWPKIPKRDDALQTHNTIETALENLKISSESLGEKSKTWEDVVEPLKQALKSLEEVLIIGGSALKPLEEVAKAIKDALQTPSEVLSSDDVVLGHLEDASKCLEDILQNPLNTLLNHISSYEYIRTQAEHIGQLELRKEMIRRELACRAELAEPSIERYLRKADGWICDHGTSIGRPAFALLCIWGFTFAAWRGWAAQEAAVTTWDVFYHTGGRMVPFVGGHAYVEEHTLKALRAAPHVLHFLSAMAAILSPLLLFLMALALRLKFRMSV